MASCMAPAIVNMVTGQRVLVGWPGLNTDHPCKILGGVWLRGCQGSRARRVHTAQTQVTHPIQRLGTPIQGPDSELFSFALP
jgi:hypothetical protein